MGRLVLQEGWTHGPVGVGVQHWGLPWFLQLLLQGCGLLFEGRLWLQRF